ncbi:unnamed protein product [Coregonus sp. 'balchen']|nr:unnamed protein product [Coregonus sp. 'balchen']
MGRKTWFSIPERNRPLKNRINIVLSRELKEPPAGAHHLASDFSSALRLLDTAEMAERADQVWVIGGSSLYKEMMESQGTRRLFVTQILQQFKSFQECHKTYRRRLGYSTDLKSMKASTNEL